MQRTLVVLGGMYHGKVIPLIVGEFRIGRDARCHLRPASTDISRLHCAIMTRPDGRVFLRDFGSANGSIVNQRYLVGGELELHDGDELEVGPLMFRFHVQEAAGTTSPGSVLATAPVAPNVNPGPPPAPRPMLPGLTTISSIPGRSFRDESALETHLENHHPDLSESNIFSVHDSNLFRPVGVETLPLEGHGGRSLPDSGPKLVKD